MSKLDSILLVLCLGLAAYCHHLYDACTVGPLPEDSALRAAHARELANVKAANRAYLDAMTEAYSAEITLATKALADAEAAAVRVRRTRIHRAARNAPALKKAVVETFNLPEKAVAADDNRLIVNRPEALKLLDTALTWRDEAALCARECERRLAVLRKEVSLPYEASLREGEEARLALSQELEAERALRQRAEADSKKKGADKLTWALIGGAAGIALGLGVAGGLALGL